MQQNPEINKLIPGNGRRIQQPELVQHNYMTRFQEGDRVMHKKFGTGIIKELHNLGDDSIVVVEFKSGTIKPLMVKYANLEKL